MSGISKFSDFPEYKDRPISYHNVNVRAHHVEMENVLGTDWKPSGDGKCKTNWSFIFHADNGESFPVSVYDWKEYDDYYLFTNHTYHIGTQTTPQSKLVAEYLESKILDFMKITRSRFYFNKPDMVKKIEGTILKYCLSHSDSEIFGATIQIYNDGEIEIGTDVRISAKNVFEPVAFLLDPDAASKGDLQCNIPKIERLVDEMTSYFYYQYLNSIQTNRNPKR